MTNYSDFIQSGVPSTMDLSYDSLADGEYNGITIEGSVDAMASIGIPLCWQSGGESGDAFFIASSSSIGPDMPCIAMATESTGGEGAVGTLLLYGFIRNNSWSWTVGNVIYLGTGGALQTTPGDTEQKLGVAITEDIIFFNPELVAANGGA